MRRAVLVVVPLLALLLGGCTGVQGTDGKEYVTDDSQVTEYTPAERGAPVESSGETLDGGNLDIADYRGKVLIVNVWWSGCGPCYTELPLVVDATTDLGDQVALVGINVRDSKADGASYERDRGVVFPSLYDPGSAHLLDFGKISPRAIPSTAVLDKQGRLAALISGPVPTKQTLVSIVDRVLTDG